MLGSDADQGSHMRRLRQLFPLYGSVLLLLGGVAARSALSGGENAAAAGPDAAVPIRPPAAWQPLAELAEHARAAAAVAAGDDIAVSVQAWGDPASGAFALLVSTRGSASSADPEEVHAGLRSTAEAAGAKLSQWTRQGDIVRLSFEWGRFRGDARVRAAIEEGDDSSRATLLACFYTTRQPERSAATCRTLVEQFEEAP